MSDTPSAAATVAKRSSRRLILKQVLLFAVSAFVLLLFFGRLHYQDRVREAESDAAERIALIGDLKAQEVSRWLKERKGDAETLFESHFALTLRRFLADPSDIALRQQVIQWIGSRNWSYGYGTVAVLDREGTVLTALPWSGEPLGASTMAFVRQALERGEIVYTDLYEDGVIRLDFVVPVLHSEAGQPPATLGALLLRIEPELFLFPLVEAWPAFGVSGEMLLVRQEGDQVAYLNRIDYGESSARFLRRPRDDAGLVSAKGFAGSVGEVRGHDYRRVEVVAAIRHVPLTDWYLVVTREREAIVAPVRGELLRSAGVALLVLVLCTLGLWAFRRRQSERVLRQTKSVLESEVRQRTAELEALNSSLRAEVEERTRAEGKLRLWGKVIEATSNGIVVTEPTREDNPIISANPAFECITGYGRDEITGSNCRFLQGEDRDQIGLEDIRAAIEAQREGHAVLRNYRKDGSMFWNELFVAPVREADGRVTHFIGVINDVTERKSYESQLEHQANHDTLTQLPNRNLLRDRLAHAIAHAERNRLLVAVLFLDLDRFKTVNDSLGHAAGDSLLRAVAGRLRRTVREEDTVARLGGDEFVVVLEGLAQAEAAATVTQKVRDALLAPITLSGQEVFVGCSVGVTFFPQDGADPDALLKNADSAMYRAKEAGRNTARFYSQEMNARSLERLVMENSLRYALERGELKLHYQPQVDLDSGRVIGVEALLRWEHPEMGRVPPSDFIPLAEETGLIVPIGEWVVRSACLQARAWRQKGLPPIGMAINLSVPQFDQPNLVDTIRRALDDSGLEPEYLELEITESLIMKDVDAAVATLCGLKALGVQLAIDDFGTGYSSLNYLKRFPIDRLKIDQSFVRDVTRSQDDAAIALAVIALAHSLRLKVVAEGVETGAQLAFLKSRRCDEIQGYYFSRPLPPGEIETLLWENRALDLRESKAVAQPILVVGSDENTTESLRRLLKRGGFKVHTANTSADGFRLLRRHECCVVVADQLLPDMDSMAFLREVRERYPESIRLLIAGRLDPKDLEDSIEDGVLFRFLIKPVDDSTLADTVREALLFSRVRGQHPARARPRAVTG